MCADYNKIKIESRPNDGSTGKQTPIDSHAGVVLAVLLHLAHLAADRL